LNPFSKGLIGAQWILNKSGLGATNHFEACAFIRSRAGIPSPNVQYHFLPAAMRYDGRSAFEGDGYQVHVGPNNPYSRGRVRINSSDPAQTPSILFNYLEHAQDRQDWRDLMVNTEVMKFNLGRMYNPMNRLINGLGKMWRALIIHRAQ